MRGAVRPLLHLTASLLLSATCGHGMETSAGELSEQRGASPASATEAITPGELVDTAWRLVRIDGQALDPDLPDITLSFGSARASGSAGCNWYTAWLERAGGELGVSHLAVTRRACAHPRIMDRETRYLAALEGFEIYRLDGATLSLTVGSTGSLVFTRG